MILTPIPIDDLPAVLARFERSLEGEALALRVLERVAATRAHVHGDDLSLSQDPEHQRQAVALVHSFGMKTIDEPPTAGFTWDGEALRVAMEPSVIVHDVAHYQLCAPDRRAVPDFGLGAGPETGLREEADAAMRLFGVAREMEEALTSLLGILWEAELGQPAICAFLEQNWLEGAGGPQARDHFIKMVRHLSRHGFITDDARPTRRLREEGDATFFAGLILSEA